MEFEEATDVALVAVEAVAVEAAKSYTVSRSSSRSLNNNDAPNKNNVCMISVEVFG